MSARATSRRRSTASRICWSTWPSRAPSAARRRAIAEEIEAVGGHLNAYTAREQTAYYAKVLAEDLPLAVDILADILQHSTFDAEELARERAVVLQEIGQAEDTPDDIIFDHFQATAFPDQPMGRPVLGKAEIVGSLLGRDHRAAICSATTRRAAWCWPRRARSITSSWSSSPSARLRGLPRERRPVRRSPPAITGGEIRSERDLEQVHLVLGLPGVSHLDPDYYAPRLLSTLVRRRHVLAPVPGDPREARPRLQHLQLRQLLSATAGSSASMPAPARRRRPRSCRC